MDAPVVIAGAGPVGLALAVGLAHHGVRSVVFEEDPTLSQHSKAPGVLPRTQEIFRAWAVLDTFLDRGFFLSRVDLWIVGEAKPRTTIDFAPLTRLTACAGVLIIPQNMTEAILHDKATASGLCDIRFGHRVVGFRDEGSGVEVHVETLKSRAPSEESGGKRYTIRAEYLVGCDGPHSTVREGLGWDLDGTTYPTRLMLADVRLPDARNDLPWPRIAPVDDGIVAAVKIEHELWRILATMEPGVADEEALSQAGLAPKVAALFGAGSFELVWADAFRIHCRTSSHFRRGRVLLAGDAAHINSPAGGQGMNSGIQDAHNLAWKLARALGGAPAEALVASYEEERRPAILTNVDRYTDLLTRTFLVSPRLLRKVAISIAQLAVRPELVMQRILPRAGMLDTRYRRSRLIAGRGRWLGARAPDAPLHDRTGRDLRLIDLAAHDAALLLFDDTRLPRWNVDEIERAVGGVPELKVHRIVRTKAAADDRRDLIDVSGAAWSAWGPDHGTAALMRPDHHVGWMQSRPSTEDLRAALRRTLGHSDC
jgi:2-polyprenyl-6-methoxyphenol hydroxylase-like FAD-dependent oxidoreductase